MTRIIKDYNLTHADYIVIGSTPNSEECIQCGTNPDMELLEVETYIEQLKRTYPPNPPGTYYFVLCNTGHDFGIYHEVAFRYNADNETEEDFAMDLEQGCENWDEISMNKLIENKHPFYYKAPPIILPFKKAQ